MGGKTSTAATSLIRYYICSVIDKKTLFTLPNIVSLAGFLLVLAGCALLLMAADRSETAAGLAFIVAGRLADLLDGRLARGTGQSTKFGAALDASLDKLAGLAIVIALLARGLAPVWAVVLIFLQNLANMIATFWAARRIPRTQLAPSDNGKYAMALQNLALGLYVVSYLVAGSSQGIGTAVMYVAHMTTILGTLVIGGLATWDYVRRIN